MGSLYSKRQVNVTPFLFTHPTSPTCVHQLPSRATGQPVFQFRLLPHLTAVTTDTIFDQNSWHSFLQNSIKVGQSLPGIRFVPSNWNCLVVVDRWMSSCDGMLTDETRVNWWWNFKSFKLFCFYILKYEANCTMKKNVMKYFLRRVCFVILKTKLLPRVLNS